MRLTPPRRMMLATAVATLGGALWLEPSALDGDAAAFAVATALLVVAGFSVGFVAHGLLTDAIVADCRRHVDRFAADAGRLVTDAERRADAAEADARDARDVARRARLE